MTNKAISMTIEQIEKADKQFKKTHKVKVSGPFDDSQIPSWFKSFANEMRIFIEKQERFNAKVLAKFAEYDKLFKQHGWIK